MAFFVLDAIILVNVEVKPVAVHNSNLTDAEVFEVKTSHHIVADLAGRRHTPVPSFDEFDVINDWGHDRPGGLSMWVDCLRVWPVFGAGFVAIARSIRVVSVSHSVWAYSVGVTTSMPAASIV